MSRCCWASGTRSPNSPRADRDLTDRELIAALANMAKSYQTLVGSGLVYQEALPGLAQQTITDALGHLLEEFREVERQHRGYTTLKDSDALTALVFTLRLAHMQTSGRPRSRRFLDFLRQRFPDAPIRDRRTGRTGQPHHRALSDVHHRGTETQRKG